MLLLLHTSWMLSGRPNYNRCRGMIQATNSKAINTVARVKDGTVGNNMVCSLLLCTTLASHRVCHSSFVKGEEKSHQFAGNRTIPRSSCVAKVH